MPRAIDAEADSILAQLTAPGDALVVLVCRRAGDRTSLIRERLLPRLNGDESFPGVYLRFGARPAQALRRALAEVATETTPLPIAGGSASLAAAEERGAGRDGSLLGELSAARERAGMPLCLFFDRFEELVNAQPSPERDEAEALVRAALAGAAGTRAVVAIRRGEVARLARYGPAAAAAASAVAQQLPRTRMGSVVAALVVALLLAAAALAARVIRVDRAHLERGAAGEVRIEGGMALPLLASDAPSIDSGVGVADLSDEGRAAVAAQRSEWWRGQKGDRLSILLGRWLQEGALAEAQSSDDPQALAAIAERQRALGVIDPRLTDVLRARLLEAVRRAHDCHPEAEGPACRRVLDDDLNGALAHALATLSPRDPATVAALTAYLESAHPEGADFALALHLIDLLGAVDARVIDRLSAFLAGSDLGARASAMVELSSVPIADPRQREEALARARTWLRNERPLQDWVTDGRMSLSALALSMSLGDAAQVPLLETALRRTATDLPGGDFFYEETVVRTLALLHRRPVDDERIRAAVRALCNDAIHNARRLLAAGAPRFRRFWRELVEVAKLEGVAPDKLVFAIFEGEGDFAGPAADDPLLVALDVLADHNPLGAAGTVELIKKRLGAPRESDCFLESLALRLVLDPAKIGAPLPERIAACAARGLPAPLTYQAQRLLVVDKAAPPTLERLLAELVGPRAERDAGYRRAVGEAIVIVGAPGDAAARLELERRLELLAGGPLYRRLAAGRVLVALRARAAR